MSVSPWLTFEKLKELQEQIDNAPAGGEDYVSINSTGTLPSTLGSDTIAIGSGAAANFGTSISMGANATSSGGSVVIGTNANSQNDSTVCI